MHREPATQEYQVIVRNDATDDLVAVFVFAGSPDDAANLALSRVFRDQGWPSSTTHLLLVKQAQVNEGG